MSAKTQFKPFVKPSCVHGSVKQHDWVFFFCLLGSLIRLYLGFCECFYFFWKNCQKKVTTIYIYGHF